MNAVPAKLDTAADSPEPAIHIAPVAGQTTESVLIIVGAAFVALVMSVMPAAKPVLGLEYGVLAVSRPFHVKLPGLVCGVVVYAVRRYVDVTPGVQLSTRWTLRKSRLASPLNTASADDCTTLLLSVAKLSRAML